MQPQDRDFSLQAVPTSQKKGALSMFPIMLGFTFFSASMWTGGILGTGLNMADFLMAVLIGNLILGGYTGFLAYISADTGLSTHLLARYAFGQKGSYLVSFILGVTQVGWFGVGVAMFALPVAKVTGINVYLLIALAGLLMTATAYFGIKSLTILSVIAVPSIFFLGTVSVSKAVASIGGLGALFQLEPTDSLPLVIAISLCIGSFISGGTLTPDFTRFSKTKRTAVITTFIAFFIGNSLMFLFGAIGSSVVGQADISEVMFKQGIILPAIIILGFNIWTTNDNALYASGLAFANITKLPKHLMVILNGILGTILAMPLYTHFVSFLNILNSVIPAIGGVLIADYFILHRRKYPSLNHFTFKTINYVAVIAWTTGVIASYLLPGIEALNGVLVALIIHVGLTKIIQLISSQHQPASEKKSPYSSIKEN